MTELAGIGFVETSPGNHKLLDKEINKVRNSIHDQKIQFKATSEHSEKTNRKKLFVEKHLNSPETNWNSNETLKKEEEEEEEISLEAFDMTLNNLPKKHQKLILISDKASEQVLRDEGWF